MAASFSANVLHCILLTEITSKNVGVFNVIVAEVTSSINIKIISAMRYASIHALHCPEIK